MRSILQIVLVLVVIMGSVFGLTFINQYKPSSEPPITGPGEPPTPEGPGVNLVLPVKIVEWDPESAGEREVHKEGHWDFWFENRKEVAVDVGMQAKSCKCTKLEACVFPAAQAKVYRQRLLAEIALPLLRAHAGAVDWITQAATELHLTHTSPVSQLRWYPLVEEGRGIVVPPAHAGLLRMNWDGKNEGAERLVVEIWTQQSGGRAHQRERLQMPIRFVPPIRIHQPTPRVEDLYPEKSGEVTFVCWSATRAAFSLDAHERTHDPCFVCSWTPLDAQQCAQLAETVKARVWCGYQVKVQVHERLANQTQLDLGPFHRQIVLSSDTGIEPGAAYVSGVVRGEVSIGTPEDKDRIDLRSFRSDRGTNKTVTLWTNQPGVELDCNDFKVEPGELGYLKGHIQLKKKEETSAGGSGARWELSVQIPPDRVSGKLPDNSAIFIKIQGSPRQVRVPIIGTAYRL